MDAARKTFKHLLATVAYRTAGTLHHAPVGFGEFRPARGVRTPRQILHHMSELLSYTIAALNESPRVAVPSPDNLAAAKTQLYAFLQTLGQQVDMMPALHQKTLEKLLQGPLADALTHVGQLALLRRMAGAPIAAENFYMASISAENLSEDQPRPDIFHTGRSDSEDDEQGKKSSAGSGAAEIMTSV